MTPKHMKILENLVLVKEMILQQNILENLENQQTLKNQQQNGTGVTLRLSSNIVVDDKTNFFV